MVPWCCYHLGHISIFRFFWPEVGGASRIGFNLLYMTQLVLTWNVVCCSIAQMKKLEEEKHLLAKVKNEIEAFVFDAQDRLEQRDYKVCSTEDERVAIAAKLSEASDWLIEQEDSTPRKVVIVCWLVVI